MYFFFILFFVSLATISLMIGRKLILINNLEGHNAHNPTEAFLSEILDFEKIKHLTIKNGKKMGHTTIWIILRTYIISSNFINKKRKELIIKIKNRLSKHRPLENPNQPKEVSKYIKVISEYRQKIRHMKHKIKVEEGIE